MWIVGKFEKPFCEVSCLTNSSIFLVCAPLDDFFFPEEVSDSTLEQMSLSDNFLQQEILNFRFQDLCILTVHSVAPTDISGPGVLPPGFRVFCSKEPASLKISKSVADRFISERDDIFESDSGMPIWYLVRVVSSFGHTEWCSILEEPISTLDKPKPEILNMVYVGALSALQTERILHSTLLERVAGVSSGFFLRKIFWLENFSSQPTHSCLGRRFEMMFGEPKTSSIFSFLSRTTTWYANKLHILWNFP